MLRIIPIDIILWEKQNWKDWMSVVVTYDRYQQFKSQMPTGNFYTCVMVANKNVVLRRTKS